MDWMEGLFGKKRDNKDANAEKNIFLNNPSFDRLKQRFIDSGKDLSAGMEATALTLGELTDVCSMYCSLSGGGSDMAQQTLEVIASGQLPEEDCSQAYELIRKAISQSTDDLLYDPIYSAQINIQQIIDKGKDDLTHYPGGLMVEDKRGLRGKYNFLLTNRQGMDDGKKEVEVAFKRVGLPVRSNIS